MERRFSRSLSFWRDLACVALTIGLAACQAPVRPSPVPSVADIEPAVPAAAPTAPLPPPAISPSKPAPAQVPAATARPEPKELTGAQVFERIVARLADPPCVEDRVVQRWERIYSRWPPRFASNLERVLPLIALVVDELEVHQLPGEFALLPIVESWYRPDAGSPRTAYGLWQFTTATARNQRLRIGPGYDERLAPQAATRAAMRYLAALMNRFDDWKLANMAFNAGEYRLLRALAKAAEQTVSSAAHRPAGLSMTTYEHVAKMQALACLIAQPQRFKLELPSKVRIEPLQEVAWPSHLSTLDDVAAQVGISAQVLRALNPVFLRGRRVAAAPQELLVPRDVVHRFAAIAAIAAVPAAAAAPLLPSTAASSHVVRRGDTLGAIALRYGVSLRKLQEWNDIEAGALIHPGQVLRLSEPD